MNINRLDLHEGKIETNPDPLDRKLSGRLGREGRCVMSDDVDEELDAMARYLDPDAWSAGSFSTNPGGDFHWVFLRRRALSLILAVEEIDGGKGAA